VGELIGFRSTELDEPFQVGQSLTVGSTTGKQFQFIVLMCCDYYAYGQQIIQGVVCGPLIQLSRDVVVAWSC
jgi:hypothetical protein